MFCPAMCSGKGICDWSLSKPACQCFDPSDTTEGCFDSRPVEPDTCPETSNLIPEVLALGLPLITIAIASYLIWKKRIAFQRVDSVENYCQISIT